MSSYTSPSIEEIRSYLTQKYPAVDADKITVADSDVTTGSVMVDYKDDAGAVYYIDDPNTNLDPVGDAIRGAVFAKVGGELTVVCAPNSRYATVVADSFKVERDGTGRYAVSVHTRSGEQTFMSLTEPTYSIFTEGALVRIWKFRGVVYHSNNKHLQYYRTMWNGLKHQEAFARLGLPTDEELFPSNVLTDPRSHIFIAVDYHFVTDSRQMITKDGGYIVYIGAHYAFDPSGQTGLFKREDNSGDLREYAGPWDLVPFRFRPKTVDVPPIVDHVLPPLTHRHLSFEEANAFLREGFFDGVKVADPRMSTGDSIYIALSNLIVRIQPRGSYWRNTMRNHQPFVKLMVYDHLSVPFTTWDDFYDNYMLIDPPTMQELKKLYEPKVDADGSVIRTYFVHADLVKLSDELADKYERNHKLYRWLVFCNVLLALPYQEQLNALQLYEDFENERRHAIKYIEAVLGGAVYHADPEKLPKVGRVNDDIVAPAGKKYLVDSSGWVRDVSSIKLRRGQTVALLKAPHPKVMEIKGKVGQELENDRLSKSRYRNVTTIINQEFNKLESNYIYQILKQAKAWYP